MMFRSVEPTATEITATLPGDDVVPDANVVMDRAFTLPATPELVWPWFEQLGRNRAGWYLPRSVERLIPRSRRALRHLDPTLGLEVGDVIADWGGATATFEVAELERPSTLVHVSIRGHVRLSWAIVLTERTVGTRVHLRLRLGGVRRKRLASVVGGVFDEATVAGLAAGLRERLVSRR